MTTVHDDPDRCPNLFAITADCVFTLPSLPCYLTLASKAAWTHVHMCIAYG